MQKTESNKNIYLKLYLQFLEMLLEIAFFFKKKKKKGNWPLCFRFTDTIQDPIKK